MAGKKSGTLLGEILIHHGVISLAQRHEAVCKQHGSGRKLGEILQELGYITISQLNAALADQQWQRQQRLKSAKVEAQKDAGH